MGRRLGAHRFLGRRRTCSGFFGWSVFRTRLLLYQQIRRTEFWPQFAPIGLSGKIHAACAIEVGAVSSDRAFLDAIEVVFRPRFTFFTAGSSASDKIKACEINLFRLTKFADGAFDNGNIRHSRARRGGGVFRCSNQHISSAQLRLCMFNQMRLAGLALS